MIFKDKSLKLFFVVIVVGSTIFCSRAFSYNNTITHPSLTVSATKVYNSNFERKLNEEEIRWLKQGSVEEDNPSWRCVNHFYNPTTGSGLAMFFSAKE